MTIASFTISARIKKFTNQKSRPQNRDDASAQSQTSNRSTGSIWAKRFQECCQSCKTGVLTHLSKRTASDDTTVRTLNRSLSASTAKLKDVNNGIRREDQLDGNEVKQLAKPHVVMKSCLPGSVVDELPEVRDSLEISLSLTNHLDPIDEPEIVLEMPPSNNNNNNANQDSPENSEPSAASTPMSSTSLAAPSTAPTTPNQSRQKLSLHTTHSHGIAQAGPSKKAASPTKGSNHPRKRQKVVIDPDDMILPYMPVLPLSNSTSELAIVSPDATMKDRVKTHLAILKGDILSGGHRGFYRYPMDELRRAEGPHAVTHDQKRPSLFSRNTHISSSNNSNNDNRHGPFSSSTRNKNHDTTSTITNPTPIKELRATRSLPLRIEEEEEVVHELSDSEDMNEQYQQRQQQEQKEYQQEEHGSHYHHNLSQPVSTESLPTNSTASIDYDVATNPHVNFMEQRRVEKYAAEFHVHEMTSRKNAKGEDMDMDMDMDMFEGGKMDSVTVLTSC